MFLCRNRGFPEENFLTPVSLTITLHNHTPTLILKTEGEREDSEEKSDRGRSFKSILVSNGGCRPDLFVSTSVF